MCPTAWTAWFVAARDLYLGDALYASYGTGSTHHRIIAEDAAERRGREPTCNAKKRALLEQLARARGR